MKRDRAILAILLALCLVLPLGACASKKTAAARAYDSYVEPAEVAYDMEAPAAVADEAYYGNAKAAGKVSTTTAQENGDSGNLTGAVAGRKIIKNGDLSVQTREFDEFITNLNQAILATGGYVEASSVIGNSYNKSRMRSADITARIPAAVHDTAARSSTAMGNVRLMRMRP